MRHFFLSFILIAILVIMHSCEEDNEEGLNIVFPMDVGNKWEYQRVLRFENIEPDSLADNFKNDTTVVTSAITGTEYLRDSIETFVFKAFEKTDRGEFRKTDYYNETENGLYIIAYSSTGGPLILPKKPVTSMIKFKRKTYSSISELTGLIQHELFMKKDEQDSIIYEYPPVQTLKYPLDEGLTWTCRNNNNPWRMDKTVLGKITISSPAGSLACYHIKWVYDMDNDGHWDDDIWIDDYIGNEGIIKRKISILGIIITNMTGDETGSFDYFEEFILKDVYLKD